VSAYRHTCTHARMHARTHASEQERTHANMHARLHASEQASTRAVFFKAHAPTDAEDAVLAVPRGTLPATTRAPLAPGLNPLCVLSPPAAMGARAQWHRGPSGCSGARPPGGRWGSGGVVKAAAVFVRKLGPRGGIGGSRGANGVGWGRAKLVRAISPTKSEHVIPGGARGAGKTRFGVGHPYIWGGRAEPRQTRQTRPSDKLRGGH